MAIEVNSTNIICSRCGKAYSRRKGYFAVNYGNLYKGIGHLSVCKDCVDDLYNGYLAQCNDIKSAVRQTCRKLDIYWSAKVFDVVEKKTATRTIMTSYLAKIASTTYAGKSYDDTLSDEGTLWNFNKVQIPVEEPKEETKREEEIIDVPKEIVAFWGKGHDSEDYYELEKKKEKWLSGFPDDAPIGVSMESHIKQICLLDLEMDKERASGRAVSDKTLKSYQDLLGSANLKPVQKQKDNNDSTIDKTPMGVWAQIYERERPIPEVDPELRDVDGIIKYISTWFLGHLCKMLGIKNTYSKLYEEAIEALRVSNPEYEDEDDEIFFDEYFSSVHQD